MQVREDWLYADEDEADSQQADSEDSNAEDWYANDYPSSASSQDSIHSEEQSSSDDY